MKQFVAIVAMIAAITAAVIYPALTGGNSTTQRASISQVGDRVVIRGCPAEDTCSIDYKANGKWVLKHQAPGTY